MSSMCPPYPAYPYIVDAGSDPRCELEEEAIRLDTLCDYYDGGGTLNPFDAAGGGDGKRVAEGSVDANAEAEAEAEADANANANGRGDASEDAGGG